MATIVNVLVLFCFLMLMHKGDAYEFVVGGQKGWSVPSDPNANPYNQWAEKSRFQVGDSLVFNYQSGQDSVIHVSSQQDYENCNTDASSEKFSDGHTVIKLKQSGPHFFISGNKNNCLKNEKLLVIVLADRTNRTSNNNQTTTPPSPSPAVSVSPSPSPLSSHSSDALTPSPSVAVSPVDQVGSTPPPVDQVGSTPPPVDQVGSTPPPVDQVGSSPPQGTVVTNPTPTPAPVSEPPPPNAASSTLVSFGCSVGALMVSLLVFSK